VSVWKSLGYWRGRLPGDLGGRGEAILDRFLWGRYWRGCLPRDLGGGGQAMLNYFGGLRYGGWGPLLGGVGTGWRRATG
jgi:hypothetical protein